MNRFFLLLAFLGVALILSPKSLAQNSAAPTNDVQYILVNRVPGAGWNQSKPDSFKREDFEAIKTAMGDSGKGRVHAGVCFIFSYFNGDTETLKTSLRRFLRLAQETDTPVLIALDGENWWNARPDFWNWWDKDKPGYNPDNRDNVEWTSWNREDAIKIAWRNWGRQIRVLPPPNLMNPRYRQECHKQMAELIPIILEWATALPTEQKDLFVGLKLGWESSIGVNSWHYPNGNVLLDKPEKDDPQSGLKTEVLPSRGVQGIGYAAAKTAGIRTEGELTEADLAEVVRRHLEDLSCQAAQLGVPRTKLFTHTGGWKNDELLYQAALNEWSCPGWSFYQHASNPREDSGVQSALQRTNAPSWAAVEWLYVGPREVEPWRRALESTLADRRCRFLCIYNWEGIRESKPILEAIRQTVQSRDGTQR